jgi:hypothetical protein
MGVEHSAERLASPMQARFDDPRTDAHQFGGLLCIQFFDVAQKQDGSVTLRQFVN